jgi:hypothetical protein
VIWQSVEFLIRVQKKEKPNFWGLTIVLILNAWARLDSALLSAVVFSFCVGMLAYSYRHNFESFLQEHGKAIAGSSLLASLGLLVQLGAFQLMGDSFLPVSALVKTSSVNQGADVGPVQKLAEVIQLGMPSILQSRFPTPALILMGGTAILLLILARATSRERSIEIRAFLNVWSGLLIGEIIYHVYIALSGAGYTPYFIWYRSPSFIFWIIAGSLLALFIFEHNGLGKLRFRTPAWAPVSLSILIFGVAVYLFVRSIDFSSKLYVARYNTALWIAENSPPDSIFASWNAGQLGFFSNRTFINLDGLINNVDYYERVLRGTVPLADYLLENKVAYIVDYSIYHPLPDYPVVRTFPLDDGSGRLIHIWQVSPQISSAP